MVVKVVGSRPHRIYPRPFFVQSVRQFPAFAEGYLLVEATGGEEQIVGNRTVVGGEAQPVDCGTRTLREQFQHLVLELFQRLEGVASFSGAGVNCGEVSLDHLFGDDHLLQVRVDVVPHHAGQGQLHQRTGLRVLEVLQIRQAVLEAAQHRPGAVPPIGLQVAREQIRPWQCIPVQENNQFAFS